MLQVGPPRDDGLHPLCSLFASLDLCDEACAVEPGGDRTRSPAPGSTGENLAARALAALPGGGAEAGLPPLRIVIDKRIPVAAGPGRRQRRRRRRPAGGERDRRAAARHRGGCGRSAQGSDPTCRARSRPAHAIVTGVGRGRRGRRPSRRSTLVLVPPAARALDAAEVYARARPARRASREQLDPARAARARGGWPRRALAAALENDLEPAALSLRPSSAGTLDRLRAAGALAAQVTGLGSRRAFGRLRRSTAAAARQRAAAAVADRAGDPVQR